MVGYVQQWINLCVMALFAAAIFSLVCLKKNRPLWVAAVMGLVLSISVVTLFYIFYTYIANYFWLLELFWIRFLLGIVGTLVGYGAHVFKKANPYRYGQSEVVIGALSACSVTLGMNPGQPLFTRWVAFAAAIYLVARGFDNWSGALEKTPNKYGYHSLKENLRAITFEKENQ